MNLATRARRRLKRFWQPNELDLTGDRDIEWGFVAGHIPDAAVSVLDFGCGNAPLGLVAALKGQHVLGIDLGPVQWAVASPLLEFRQADLNTHDFGSQTFDVILNCSTVEHAGLSGRFDSPEDVDGDLKAMSKMRQLLKPGGKMILTIPIGQDRVCRPLHRIYGRNRLPRLIEGYVRQQGEYWVKRSARNVWVPSDETEALAYPGGPALYALGLFILTRE